MMEEKIQSFFNNFLQGRELLQHKGIRFEALDEYERSSKVLPKTGKKLFEPIGLWLQQKQVEKGLQLRRDFLDMKRIERKSHLAVAEWLPHEKKVRVLKKSGQEWANFGLEVNGVLHLIPEEALLLLEMNCIELLWDEVAITLEQAYNILLDADISECSLEEYKVYSQFLRRGYRVQRCFSLKLLPKKRASIRESINPHKKIIISALTGLRNCNIISRYRENIAIVGKNKCSNRLSNAPKKRNLEEYNIEDEDNNDNGIDGDSVKTVIETIISNLESKEQKKTPDNQESHKLIKINEPYKSELSEKNTSIPTENLGKQTVRKRNCNSKAEIISEESVSQCVKILKDISRDNSNTEKSASKRLCTRIKRNVKLLPKRANQIPVSTIIPESSQIDVNENTNEMKRMRNALFYRSDGSASKKQCQEIIELSDDEVEEVRTPLTQVRIFKQLPNIASQALKIMQRTLKVYIPHNIEMRRDVYHYEQVNRLYLQRGDNSNRLSSKSTQNSQHSTLLCTNPNQLSDLSDNCSYERKAQMHILQKYNRRITLQSNLFSDFQYCQWNIHNENSFLQQNSYLEFQHTRNRTWLQSRKFQAHNYNNVLLGLMGNVMKSYIVRNQFPLNVQSIPPFITWQNSGVERGHDFNLKQSFNISVPDESLSSNNNFSSGNNVPSYAKDQEPSTWLELRKKWQEECTITINDEDLLEAEAEKHNEIEIVKQQIKPLIIIKRNTRLSEISDKLKLIKKSTKKSQRQKQWDYSASYNVYSGGSHYKKANPGSPLCRLLIIRKYEDHLNPLEVRRLPLSETDAPFVIAYVSKTSISYIQLGTISIPDLN
ncbi:uncharacterized protein LOC117171191 [Belonocnema kinseyi]|uniref:uncharacterized protein LOC117171191 n=1 Tax=Belonocnema kinseyi TaxID=2817044 RepID=UPI00143DFCC2|nr:uncharacterized protein LOC117171191 [Belonocnema kinseyi]